MEMEKKQMTRKTDQIELEKRITNTSTYLFPDTNEEVTVDVINDKTGFIWRLRIGNQKGEWTGHYEGIATIQSAKTHALYGYLTAYWEGSIPIEKPFHFHFENMLVSRKNYGKENNPD